MSRTGTGGTFDYFEDGLIEVQISQSETVRVERVNDYVACIYLLHRGEETPFSFEFELRDCRGNAQECYHGAFYVTHGASFTLFRSGQRLFDLDAQCRQTLGLYRQCRAVTLDPLYE